MVKRVLIINSYVNYFVIEMNTKILLVRLLDPIKKTQFVNVLSTIVSLKEDCNCYMYVSRDKIKFRVPKTDANLCDLLVQFSSIFFDDYKYISGDYVGHAFLLQGMDDIVDMLDISRKAVN